MDLCFVQHVCSLHQSVLQDGAVPAAGRSAEPVTDPGQLVGQLLAEQQQQQQQQLSSADLAVMQRAVRSPLGISNASKHVSKKKAKGRKAEKIAGQRR